MDVISISHIHIWKQNDNNMHIFRIFNTHTTEFHRTWNWIAEKIGNVKKNFLFCAAFICWMDSTQMEKKKELVDRTWIMMAIDCVKEVNKFLCHAANNTWTWLHHRSLMQKKKLRHGSEMHACVCNITAVRSKIIDNHMKYFKNTEWHNKWLRLFSHLFLFLFTFLLFVDSSFVSYLGKRAHM